MNKKMSKRQRDIKSKLMAAIAMLLVSSIMMVSTTYAWFTLSTAPEVTGITTSVGANGNLEMALLPANALTAEAGEGFGITSGTSDSMGDDHANAVKANVTWGNLVDLADESYGLKQIKLYPAALNTADKTDDALGNPTQLAASYLQTPEYGSDGRVSMLVGNTVTGRYDGTAAFNTSDETGVRAVGNASGMSQRQILYRNAVQAGSSSATQALNKVTNSLTTRGSTLASIAIKHGTTAAGTTEEYTNEDVKALIGVVSDLQEVMALLEQSYMKYIEAYVISADGIKAVDGGMTAEQADNAAVLFSTAAAGAEDVDALIDLLADVGVTVPSAVEAPINALQASQDKVESAASALDALKDETNVTWSQISSAMSSLLNTDLLEVNGYKVGEIMSKIDEFASAVMGTGVTVTMPSGSGVYSDIADQAGDFGTSIKIAEIKYGTLSMKNTPARMTTKTSLSSPYLTMLNGLVAGKDPSSEGSSSNAAITDVYGYVIDLAFRTNAADSKLKLQTAPAGRIYGTEDSEETMGHGATMTFTSQVPTFTVDNVKSLMETIRIVFFNPQGLKVMATAKLDMTAVGADDIVGTSVTAPIKLYTITDAATTNYKEAADGVGNYYYTGPGYVEYNGELTHYTTDGKAYAPVAEGQTANSFQLTGAETTDNTNDDTYAWVKFEAETTGAGQTATKWLEGDDAVITALDQNTAQAVSVLVYMDGNAVTNADVAYEGNTSAVGTMNLQFSSSANLVPMEYTALKNQGGSSAATGTALTAISVQGTDGAALTGVTATGAFEEGGKVTIKVTGAESISGVSVAGTALESTAYTVSGDTITFTKADIAADTAIVITATAAAAAEPTT